MRAAVPYDDRANDAVAPGPVYWFEVGDLLSFLRGGSSPTGIQRIMLELLPKLLERRVKFCRNDGLGGRLVPVALDTILDAYLNPGSKGRFWPPAWWRGKGLDLAAGGPTPVKRGDVLVCLGMSWFIRNHNRRIARLKSEHGMRVALLIHDLIPLTHPDFVARRVFKAFANWIDGAIANADLLLAVSDYSAGSLQEVATRRGWRLPPIALLRFGAEPFGRTPRRDRRDSASVPALSRFVLYVATFERRKNHQFLFDVWQHLCSTYGAAAVPDLVLVGKRQGLIDKRFERNLRRSKAMGGKIHVLTNLGDDALRTLYERCAFTVFPSLIEGWGLPVAESLSYGKMCVASNRTSIPDVGGDLACYFDPDDFDGAVALMARAIFDRDWRESQEQRIRMEFKAPRWSDCARSLMHILEAHFGQEVRF